MKVLALVREVSGIPEVGLLPSLLFGGVFVWLGYWLSSHYLRPVLKGFKEGLDGALKPVRRIWGDLGFLVLIYLFSVTLVGLLGSQLFGSGSDENGLSVFVIIAVSNLMVVFGLFAVVQSRGGGWGHFGFHKDGALQAFGRGALLYLCCFPAMIGLGSIWGALLNALGEAPQMQEVAEMVQDSPMGQRVVVLLFAAAIIPFLEEIIFRGFVQKTLVRLAGALPGIWMASIFFALMHGIHPFGGLLVISLAAGFAFHWSGSLWAAIGVHATNNAVSTLLLFTVPELLNP